MTGGASDNPSLLVADEHSGFTEQISKREHRTAWLVRKQKDRHQINKQNKTKQNKTKQTNKQKKDKQQTKKHFVYLLNYLLFSSCCTR
jgi:hypothetical protein